MRRVFQTGLALATLSISSATVIGAEKESFLTYTLKGGKAVMDIRVEIEEDTRAVRVQETRMFKEKVTIDYRTVLTKAEQAEFVARIRKVDFFKLPAPKQLQPKPGHAGLSTLKVSLDGESRTRMYRDDQELVPVQQLLWKLVYQARAVHSLRPGGTARLSGADVLQPTVMKAPLMKYIRTHKKWGDVNAAILSLAKVTTAKEFHAFVVAGLKDGAAERDTLLTLIGTFRGTFPQGHLDALLPVYLDFVKSAGIPPKLKGVESQAFDQFLRMIGKLRYEAAIPVLLKGFEAHTRPGVTTYQTPLAKMGLPGLKALVPYLSSEQPAHRRNATELLVIASRSGPNCGFTNPVSEAEYKRMKQYFEATVLPKLATIAKPDRHGKNRGKEAIEEIQGWLKK